MNSEFALSPSEIVDALMNDVETAVQEARDSLEETLIDVQLNETRRCMTWLRSGICLDAAIEKILSFEEPSVEAVSATSEWMRTRP